MLALRLGSPELVVDVGRVPGLDSIVLYERVAYDEEATLQSTTYLDYLIPTSMEIPSIEIEHLETLSPGENDFQLAGVIEPD